METFGEEVYTDVTGIVGGVLLLLGFVSLAIGARRVQMLSGATLGLVLGGVAVVFVASALDPGWADWIVAAGTAVIFWTFAYALRDAETGAVETAPFQGLREDHAEPGARPITTG